ncbi:uncharacterized protein LOC112683971 [Sipha flava]|jgi:hypothetical protein|uniref:Uncharacterized protein LOC112683971 n=1 Tax=Sipha flava TaxID=143950 RepID=A0A8B8FL18_9HEMI|nr:uncharacterized protein LOC112683971 [Sipha flava]
MSFIRRRSSINHAYLINNIPIPSVSHKKDLYIFLSYDLNYPSYIQSISCKAYKTLGFIKLISSDFNLTSSIKALYCSLIQSQLEYGSVLWDPHTASDSATIERVQRRFLFYAGYVLGIPHSLHDYSPVLHELNLLTLADRRLNSNFKFLQNLIGGISDAPSLLSLINFCVLPRPTRSTAPVSIPKRSTNYSQNNPIDRLMRLANNHSSILLYS